MQAAGYRAGQHVGGAARAVDRPRGRHVALAVTQRTDPPAPLHRTCSSTWKTSESSPQWRASLVHAPTPHRWQRPLHRSSLVTRSVAVELLGKELSTEEASLWQASCQALSSGLGFSDEESQRLLARAFGWTTQAFWRQEKVEEVPTPQQVEGALAFLREDLAMSGEEQSKVVRIFPELLACDLDQRLRANVAQLTSQWRLQGPTLTKAVLRQPQVLGYSIDCSGDCIGECNRCWARF